MSEHDVARKPLCSVGGREHGFADGAVELYEATITVRLSHRPGRDDSGLRCVAERAVYAAASAYNFYDTRINRVDLVSIEEVERDAAD